VPANQLKKLIMRIKTNSLEPGQPKETTGSTLFEIYQAFATQEETAALARRYAEGAGWGDLKKELFDYLDAHLAEARSNYERLVADPGHVERVLRAGAERARQLSVPFMKELRHAVGLRPLG